MSSKFNPDVVIDAKNATLGRLASYVSKRLLLGSKIAIINCNECVIVGNPSTIIKEYQKKVARKGSSMKGPFFPKIPERIVKRSIRGMLPDYRIGRGKILYSRVRCFNTTPAEFADAEKINSGKPKISKTMKLKELSGYL